MSDDQPQGNENSGTPDQGQTGGSEWKPPQSQDELNRIIQSRVAQVERKYADYGELKAKATEYDQFKTSQLTETEKAIRDAKAEGAQEASKQWQSRLLTSEVKAAASRLRFHDPSDALTALTDRDKLVTKDGDIDTDAVSKALTDLATRKPYLVEVEPTGPKAATRPRARQSHDTTTPPATGKGRAADALRQFASGR